MVAGTAGPLGLVEETYAAAEFDLAGRTCFQLLGIRITVEDGYAGTGATIGAGMIWFCLPHDSVLVPCNDHDGHVPGEEGQPTALAAFVFRPASCRLTRRQ